MSIIFRTIQAERTLCQFFYFWVTLKFQHKLRMSHEPVLLEHVSTTSDLQGRFFASHPEQEGGCRDMEEPIPPLGTDDHFSTVLWDEWPPPALPAPRLVPDRRLRCLPAGRRGTCQQRPGAAHVPRDGACGLLGGRLPGPRWRTGLAAAVLAETASVGGVAGGEGLLDGLVGQQDPLPARARVPLVPLPDAPGLARGLLDVLAVPLPRGLCGAILVVGGAGGEAHHRGLQACRPAGRPLPVGHGTVPTRDEACTSRGQGSGLGRHGPSVRPRDRP